MSTRLEITCGEAPFLVSRYDASSGELLEPTLIRMGILDRKLRVVGENTECKEDWIDWDLEAVKSCYGYEYQGDSLLIARINILLTFTEYYEEKWEEEVEDKLLNKLAKIISWNIWQMDGLTDTVPFAAPFKETEQLSIFDIGKEEDEEKEEVRESIPCRIYDWRANRSIRFMDIKER